MKIIIENADQRDFNELANLARHGKIHTFYMTDEEERPQGEWNYIQAGMAVCPFCGASPHKDYKNFCPKCGARMGGSEK